MARNSHSKTTGSGEEHKSDAPPAQRATKVGAARQSQAKADELNAAAADHEAAARENRAAAKDHEAAAKAFSEPPPKAEPERKTASHKPRPHGKIEAAHKKKDASARVASPPRRHKVKERAKAVVLVVHRRWPWAVAALVVLLGIAGVLYYRHHVAAEKAAHPAKVPPIPVTAEAARKGDIGVTVTAIGTVTPLQSVSITARVQGQITKVSYQEGQLVHKGDPLVDIDPRPYQAALIQAEGQLAHDAAILNEARIDLQRYKDALALNAISRQQVEDQAQVVVQDEGTVKMDQGTVDNAKANLSYCHIVSPIDGRVGLRLVDPGNMVQTGSTTPLVSVAQLQPITVIFSVAEDSLPPIEAAIAQGGSMKVDALDRSDEKKLATGELRALDNMVDTTTGTVRLRAQFENKDGALFPNQFVNAQLLVKTIHDATLVPSSAVQRNTNGAFAYVIAGDKAELRNIKPGVVQGNDTQVEGVNPGEQVATSGFNKLKDGVQVTIQPAQQQAADGGTPDAGTGP